MSVVSESGARAKFISADQACDLMASSERVSVQLQGGLSVHQMRHESHGSFLLVQGGAGEFALIEPA